MRLSNPGWLYIYSLWYTTVYSQQQLRLDISAAAPNIMEGHLDMNPCNSINCTAYNVTQFNINIAWSTVTHYQPFSVVLAASQLLNTSDLVVISDDMDFLSSRKDVFRNPESPIVRLPWKRNTEKWRVERGLKPMSAITPEDNYPKPVNPVQDEGFDFCESRQSMEQATRDVIADIVIGLKWKQLIIICDQSTELTTMHLSTRLHEHGVTTTILAINESSTDYATYPGLKATYDRVVREELDVLLMCSLGCVKRVLEEANIFDVEQKNLTAIRHSSKWLVSHYGFDQNYLEKSGLTLDNVAVLTGPSFRECYPTNVKKVLPELVQSVLRRLEDEPEYEGQVSVDVIIKSQVISVLENPTVKTKVSVATLLWKQHGRRELANVDMNNVENIFPNSKFGFNQRLFQIATLEYSPFVIKKVTNGTAEYTGLCMDLLLELSTSLNFSFVMVEPPDGEWGRVNNGQWTGLIGQVARQESDMILAAVTVSNEREAVMDFTFPYYFGYSVVFFRKPDPNADKWYTLLAPFRWQVLLCIFGSVLFTGCVLYFVEKVNPFYTRKYPKRKKHIGIQSVMWYLYGALLSHGGNTIPESAAGRLIISTWWLFCMVCAATYSGNLIAFLTVATKKVPFNTLAEMVAKDDYKWGYLQGSFLETLFKNSNLPTYQRVWEGVKRFSDADPDHLHPSIDEHFNRMMNSKYAVIDDGSSIFSWSEHQCEIEILNERFFPNHYALGLPNNSPFTSIISNQMIKIYESGLLQVWQQNWWPKTKFCSGSLTSEAEAIDLLSLQSAFYVLCIGLFLAFSILAIEHIRKCLFPKVTSTPLDLPDEKQ